MVYSAYEFTINNDLRDSNALRRSPMNSLERNMKKFMMQPLYNFIMKNSNELICKKIPYSCACMKMTFNLHSHSLLHVLFHAFMTKYMTILYLYNMSLVDAYAADV